MKKILRFLKHLPKYHHYSFGSGDYVQHVSSMDEWIKKYSSKNGIFIHDATNREYPEVTGYWLETLSKWGYAKKAKSWFNWLIKIQHSDGGWPGEDISANSSFFDSGQVVRGIKYYSDNYGSKVDKSINKYLKYFDDNYKKHLIPSSLNDNVSWHLINLQVAWIVHKYWPDHVSISWLSKNLEEYIKSWDVGYQASHFDIYILEAIYELKLFPSHFQRYLKYFEDSVAKYELVPCDRDNHAPCYTATAQLGVLYYKMGKYEQAEKLMFRMLDDLNLKRGNWPGSPEGGNYYVNREVSWGLKYFLDMLYAYSMKGYDLDPKGEWNVVDNSFHTRILESINNYIEPSDKVLDLGCGLGRYIEKVQFPKNAYGIDISTANVKSCIKKGLKVTQTSLTELLLPNSFPRKYDVIFSIEAFEHSVFAQNAINQAAELLNAGGRLVIVDKNFWKCMSYQLCPLEQYFTKNEYKKLAINASLKIKEFKDISDFIVVVMVKN